MILDAVEEQDLQFEQISKGDEKKFRFEITSAHARALHTILGDGLVPENQFDFSFWNANVAPANLLGTSLLSTFVGMCIPGKYATFLDFQIEREANVWPMVPAGAGIHEGPRVAAVRRAALAFAREVERRAPAIATSKWWKEERHGVFLDYNQNAKDRTVAAAYSVRPTPDARVSAPVTWQELAECDPRDFTLKTMPGRFAEVGDRHAEIDTKVCELTRLLELSDRHQKEGLGDAPWPPHYRKQEGEPARVQPSRRRTPKFPLIEIGRAQKKEDALAGLERWRVRHPDAASHLQPADVLVDAMRGRFRTWTRIRINLQHVPEDLRPPQEPLDPDETLTW
jgi:hypothetical protein